MSTKEDHGSSRAALKVQRQRAIVGTVSLIVALVYTQQASLLSFGTLARPGAGTYPMFIGVLFILFSVIAIVEPLRAMRRGIAREAGLIDTLGGDDVASAVELAQTDDGDARRAGFYVAALAGYIILLPVLGFTVANAVFIIIVAFVLGVDLTVRSRMFAAIVAVTFSLSLTWFFVSFLGTRMPQGWLFG